jgi:tRNA threonylcarbamoyladenosine biosynthesis protein TsaE
MKYITSNLKDVEKIALKIVNNLKEKKFILLNGEIGSGKTTLVKFIAKHLGESSTVNSPTFNLMKIYDKFVHIDAYNILGNLESYEDYFENKIIIIEWANNLQEIILNSIVVDITINKKNQHIYIVNYN